MTPRQLCERCHVEGLRRHSVIHHYLCAYVGPDYDFALHNNAAICPKCKRSLNNNPKDWEDIGASFYCSSCGAEYMELA
jgi:hypothetical protein